MKTIKEYNRDFPHSKSIQEEYPKLNGLICDLCNSYLVDTSCGVLLCSPPLTEVKCTKCDFKGYRYV